MLAIGGYGKYLNYGNPINRQNRLMDGLVSRWKVVPYYSSGGRLIDLNQRNNATMQSTVFTSAFGRTGGGGAVQVDGTTSTPQADSFAIDCNADLTVSLWVNSAYPSTSTALLTISDATFNGIGFRTPKGTPSFTWRISRNSSGAALASTVSFGGSGWLHLAYAQRGTTNEIYINGVSYGSTTNARDAVTSTRLWIGKNTYPSGAGSEQAASGTKLDDIKVWNRGLQSSDILSDYMFSSQQYDPTLNWYSHPVMMGATAAASGGPFPWYLDEMSGGFSTMGLGSI